MFRSCARPRWPSSFAVMAASFLALCGKSKPSGSLAHPLQVVVVVLACLTTPAIAEPTDSKDAIRAFIERVNKESGRFFVSGSEADARQRCRDLLAWAFDVPAMGKEVLGKAGDKATDEERKKYMEAFEDEVISAYLRRMRPP